MTPGSGSRRRSSPAGRRGPRCSRSTWSGSPPSTRGWGLSSWSGPRRSGPGEGPGGPDPTWASCLAGVPVAVKDSVDLAGTPTRSGSAATMRQQPTPTPNWSGACARPGRCWSARPACPSWACGRSPRARRSGSAPEPLEPGARPRRLLGRQRGRGGGGHGPDRPGRRRGARSYIQQANCGLVGVRARPRRGGSCAGGPRPVRDERVGLWPPPLPTWR